MKEVVLTKPEDYFGDTDDTIVVLEPSELELLKVILDIDIRDGKMSGAETGYIKTAEALLKKLEGLK